MVIEHCGFFLACNTYCDTRHTFIMVISEDPWHTPFAERLAVELSLLVFLRIRSVADRIWTTNLPLAPPTLWPTAPLLRFYHLIKKKCTCICINSNIDIFLRNWKKKTKTKQKTHTPKNYSKTYFYIIWNQFARL